MPGCGMLGRTVLTVLSLTVWTAVGLTVLAAAAGTGWWLWQKGKRNLIETNETKEDM